MSKSKSLAFDKTQYKSLAFRDRWNPYKILVSPSMRNKIKYIMLGGQEGGGRSIP